jgi:hypothetical protein
MKKLIFYMLKINLIDLLLLNYEDSRIKIVHLMSEIGNFLLKKLKVVFFQMRILYFIILITLLKFLF